MRGKTAATVAVAQPSDFSLSDARRISALPDLEAAYLDLYDEVKRLRADLRHVIDERDSTFALMLARAESAEKLLQIERHTHEWAENKAKEYRGEKLQAVAERDQALRREAALLSSYDEERKALVIASSERDQRRRVEAERDALRVALSQINGITEAIAPAIVGEMVADIQKVARQALKGQTNE